MSLMTHVVRRFRRWYASHRLEHQRASILALATGGEGFHLDGPVTVAHADRLVLGKNVHIGRDARIHCLGGVSIGDHTAISERVTIYSYNHEFKNPESLPIDRNVELKPVSIGKYVWIGMNVTIAPGTTIEDGAVIGMGTVVSGHVPSNAIVVNQPPRIVGYRDSESTAILAANKHFYQIAA